MSDHSNRRPRGLTGRLNGSKLRDARIARGWSQADVARMVGLSAGRSGARTIGLIENNRCGTSIRTARAVCHLYNLRLCQEFEPQADSVWGTLAKLGVAE